MIYFLIMKIVCVRFAEVRIKVYLQLSVRYTYLDKSKTGLFLLQYDLCLS